MKYILFLIICIFASQQGIAQKDIKSFLHGGDAISWELRTIIWDDGERLDSEEFGEGEGDDYTLNNDDATLIPETITFYKDGTCELLYIAYYGQTDSDEDEELIDESYVLIAKWTLTGNNIRITEPEDSDGAADGRDDGGLDPYPGYCWQLTNIKIENATFSCGYDFYGFNSGIKTLIFEAEK